MKKWGYRDCTFLGSTFYIIQCQAEVVELVYWGAVVPLGDWLVKNASQDVQEAVMDHIHAYREHRPVVTFSLTWVEEMQEACRV